MKFVVCKACLSLNSKEAIQLISQERWSSHLSLGERVPRVHRIEPLTHHGSYSLSSALGPWEDLGVLREAFKLPFLS